jgi:hypothetical protein
MKALLVTSALTAFALAACAPITPGAEPHQMSAAQHEAAATSQERTAELHSAQYNPQASVTAEQCRTRGCWTSVTNPTAEHLKEAEKYRKMAADHRAASQALRDAEARACVGISEDDRDMSPFEHREDIASVEPLTISTMTGKNQYARTVGAVITFRARPGMTAQWLQRVIDCHLARNAALGHDVPGMSDCPLVPKGVTAKVTATDTGFAVAVRAEDTDTIAEIQRRARALAPQ